MPMPTSIIGGTVKPDLPIFETGALSLFNTLLRVVFLLAGIYAFWNFIFAGFKFLSAGGNPETIGQAWGTIWKSLLGLLIIVTSFVFAALIGWLFFGSPTAILKPELVVK